jgi:hypothetical protein
MTSNAGTPDRMAITGRLNQLHETYSSAFKQEFDPKTFRADDFYAFQVLEKAIREGTPEMRELAQMLQDYRLSLIDGTANPDRASAPAQAAPVAAVPAPVAPVAPAAALGAVLAPEAERRERSVRSAGHVRLGYGEIVSLSQMRTQYRKIFGVTFDPLEFTGNDLYARALLDACIKSGDPGLEAVARHFLEEDGTPRFHRRKGEADLEINLPEAPD